MPKPKSGKNKKNKKVAPVFRIFCEGKKTEPYYLRGYIDAYHSDNRRLLVVENAKKNTPKELVREAIAHKKSGNLRDIYWVVFDRESITKYKHEDHLEARKVAKDHHIEIAFSNVCIEYWFLLHFDFTAANYASCEDLLKRSALKKNLLERGIKSYDKGFAFLFDRLKQDDGVTNALVNGERIREQSLASAQSGKSSPCYLNPYTDVHELLVDMKNFVESKDSIRSTDKSTRQQMLIDQKSFIDAKDGKGKNKP